ncbi:phosphoglycerate dehydrogenase [Brevibacterium sp. 5221]|uniref:D-3-phosphoglycerate dehydrogenase n=1 Tax=Brevibacterium rongguiense TaxID=2695267 RepID=A0A6N9H9U1_9MICO|nr:MULTISPECIES: phosphoglycerate dehydrogenase [Brevibacterium]MYM20799.1 phosphoglycerate dehydrogenase [Brevibacterium rongguiense]WAL41388.1 phosphoglycerate dehydrogenase [Brevibacterium sp. BRM-1]
MPKPVVLIAENLSPATVEALGPDFEIRTCNGADRGELLAALPGADAVLIRSATQMDAEAIAAADRLKVIARAGVGLDNVDVPAATRAGVMVVNAPTSNIVSAAELTMAHILASARNFGAGHTSLKAGQWNRSKLTGVELYEKTLGIVGLGRIGGLIAERAKAFGMKLVGYDPYITQARAAQMGVSVMSLDEVLEASDFITVHMPKTPETIGMIGREALAKAKPGVRIVNVARGGIVDEEALAEAVASGQVAGAGIDVWSVEPPEGSPLMDLDAVNVTPHLGASTAEAQEKAGVAVAKSVRRALSGELVPDAVNVAGGAIDPDVRPGIPLAERLGRVVSALAESPVTHLRVEVHGEIADKDVSVLTLSALKGLFMDVVSTPVSYVNAPVFAEERGLSVESIADHEVEAFRNLTTLVATTSDGQQVRVSGTVTGPKLIQKLTEVNGFELEIQLADHLLVFRYQDRPGIIGQLGQALGAADINIAGMQVSPADGEALSVMAVDSPVTGEVVAAVAGAVDASSFSVVNLVED